MKRRNFLALSALTLASVLGNGLKVKAQVKDNTDNTKYLDDKISSLDKKLNTIHIALTDDMNSATTSLSENLDTIQSSLKNDIDSIKKSFLDKTYPIGSIYISINNKNPSTIFGGTWTAWGGVEYL